MTELGGTRALVTGATSGLGLAMARALVDAGARVAITSRTRSAPHTLPPISASASSALRWTFATSVPSPPGCWRCGISSGASTCS